MFFLHLHCCVFGGELEQLLYCCTSTASTVSCLSVALSSSARSLDLRVLFCNLLFSLVLPRSGSRSLYLPWHFWFHLLHFSLPFFSSPFDYHVLMTSMASGALWGAHYAQMKREINCSSPTPLPHRHSYVASVAPVFLMIILSSIMYYVRETAC